MREATATVQLADRSDPAQGAFAVWWTMAVLALAGLISIVDRATISVMLIDMKASLALEDTEISLAQGFAFAGVYCLASPLMGTLADRMSRRLILAIGIVVWSLAATSTAFVTGFGGLLMARMLIGLGEATVTPCALSILSQIRRPDQLSSAVSMFVAAGTAGTGIAFGVGGWLLDRFAVEPWLDMDPWRQVMIALGLPGVAVALLVLTIREPRRAPVLKQPDGAGAGSGGIGEFLVFVHANGKAVFALLASFGLASTMIYSAMAWGATYGRRVIGLPATEIGGVMGLISGAVGIVAAIAMGMFVDRLYARGHRDAAIKVFVVGVAVSLVVGIPGFLLDDRIVLYVSLFAIQCGIGSTFGTMMALQQNITPRAMRGRMGALAAMTSNIVGFSIGPLAVGLLTDTVYADPDKVGWSIATVLLVAGIIAAALFWRARHAVVALMDEAER